VTERRRLYGVGTGKTGTHSLAAIFERDHRAAHEGGAKELMEIIFAVADGTAPRQDIRDHLVERDARLALDMDASLVNGEVVADLVALFPGSRYVLTVREPHAWLDSMANHSLAHETPPHWVRWRELRFRSAELTHPSEEAAWRDRGLYTLDGYLGSWARHNRMVLEAVPADDLLIVRTEDLADRLDELAGFCGVPAESLDHSRVHSFPAAGRFGALADLDPAYVDERIAHHCGALLGPLGL
jgi:hypothetical protein